jgi:predicted transcriptional regulator
MPRRKTDLTPAQIAEYRIRNPHITQEQIAEMHGITPSRVSQIKHSAGGYRTPREIVMDHYPWTVGREFTDQTIRQYTAHHLEYMATRGKGMSQRQLTRLRQFYQRMRKYDWVVEFNPEAGGFSYQKRTESDEDLIIRVNKFTAPLSAEGRLLWRYPPEIPPKPPKTD